MRPVGPGAAVELPVMVDERDDRWEELASSALERVPRGGHLVLRVDGRCPEELRPAWHRRLVGLLRGGLTMHDRAPGRVVLRRDRLRVLYLAPWVTFGGSDRGTIDWLRFLSSDEFARYLLTTQESDNALFAQAERLADEAWCLPELAPGRVMPDHVLRFVASRGVDLVHVMNSKLGFDLLPGLRARYPFLRTVVQLHAEEPDRSGYPSYVATRFDASIDAYSVVSEDLRRSMVEYGVAPGKTHVIYLGVDPGSFAPATSKEGATTRRAGAGLRVLFPHRLCEQKDPLLMVEVAAQLRAAGSGAVVHVVGDGELRPAVERAVARAGLGDRVRFHGAQREMAGWYRETDVALLTSRYEGVPLVAYEAMATGRPVVAADVGGIGEVVDERCGYLIRPRDSASAYVAALHQLELHPIRRERLGAEGRERILSRFTVSAMAEGHERLYVDLAARFLGEAL